MTLLVLLVTLAFAPFQRPTDVVKWSVEAPSAAVVSGGTVDVRVRAVMQPGWKLYAIEQPEGGPKPLAFGVAGDSPFQILAKRIAAPKPSVLAQDVNFSTDTRFYEKEAAFTVPVAVPRSVNPGSHEIPFEVTFQACGAELCLRPFTQKLPVKVSITP